MATDFEHRSFGQELALCQRYFQVLMEVQTALMIQCLQVVNASSTVAYVPHRLVTTMRSTPSFTLGGTAIMILDILKVLIKFYLVH